MEWRKSVGRRVGGIIIHCSVMAMVVGCVMVRPDHDSAVSEKTAFQQAAVAMVEHVLIPSGYPVELEEPVEGWESARLGEAVLFYDINEKPLLYGYPIIGSENLTLGQIWVAADKAVGATVVLMREGPTFFNVPERLGEAATVARSRYPAWDIDSVLPVVYSFPRIGVLVKMRHPGTGQKNALILDFHDFSETPTQTQWAGRGAREELAKSFSWSFLDAIPAQDRQERMRQWEAQRAWEERVLEVLRQNGGFPEDLKEIPLKNVLNLLSVAKAVYAEIQCTIYTTRNPWFHYCQSGVPFCAAAVGRNIAAYYGINHSEATVAQLMGITKKNWPTVQGELTYYKSPQGVNKAGSEAFTDETAMGQVHLGSWKSILKETRKDQGFVIPSSIGFFGGGAAGAGGWPQPRHWNALYGMKVCLSPQGDEDVKLFTFDPWPPETKDSQGKIIETCEGNVWASFAVLKGTLRSHTIPKDPEPPPTPTWPSQPTFEPWKCEQEWYKLLYQGSCKKWEDLLKIIGPHPPKGPP